MSARGSDGSPALTTYFLSGCHRGGYHPRVGVGGREGASSEAGFCCFEKSCLGFGFSLLVVSRECGNIIILYIEGVV